MNEQEIARRRHEYLLSQLPVPPSDLTGEPSRAQAIAEGRGSYVTKIPCAVGHQHRRFTSSTDCCVCYDDWKRQKAMAANLREAAINLERERRKATQRTQEQYDQAWQQPPSIESCNRTSSTRLIPQIGDS